MPSRWTRRSATLSLRTTSRTEDSGPRVYRAAVLVLPDPQFASDATQEAFEKAYARWRRLNKQQWVAGWVMTRVEPLSQGAWATQCECAAATSPRGSYN